MVLMRRATTWADLIRRVEATVCLAIAVMFGARGGVATGRAQTGDKPAEATAQIFGRVLTVDGRGIRRAQVRLTSPPREARLVGTDGDGRWAATDLPAGRYAVQAEKEGYLKRSYGQRGDAGPGTPLVVDTGSVVRNIDIVLKRAGAIVGQVFDEWGDPVANVRVAPMNYRQNNWERRIMAVGPGDVTDDLGQYRLYGLAPGQYYVCAKPA